jgi:hypothetical protein
MLVDVGPAVVSAADCLGLLERVDAAAGRTYAILLHPPSGRFIALECLSDGPLAGRGAVRSGSYAALTVSREDARAIVTHLGEEFDDGLVDRCLRAPGGHRDHDGTAEAR